MHPTRLTLSDARITTLEASVAKLLGRVTVLKAFLLPDPLQATLDDLRPHSPQRASASEFDAFVTGSPHPSLALIAGSFPR